MKNQHVKHERRNQPLKIAVLLAMLLIVGCFCGILVFAANDADTAPSIAIDAEGIVYEDATGTWVKTYDGNVAVDASSITVNGQNYRVVSASFDSADAGTQKITVTYLQGTTEKIIRLPARIDPVEIKLIGTGTASITYNPANPLYENVSVEYDNVTLDATAQAAGLEIDTVGTISVNTAEVASGQVNAYAQVSLKAPANVNLNNYKVALLPVTVNVQALVLTDIRWSNDGAYSFTYGEWKNASNTYACLDISATATASDGTIVPLKVMVIVDGEAYTLAEAYELGYYGNVYVGHTQENYTLEAWSPNEALYTLDVTDEALKATVTIKQSTYTVSLSDKTYLGEADMSDPTNIKPMVYRLYVGGNLVPADVLAKIRYTYYDANGNIVSEVTEPGIYTVVATLPALVENGCENYCFSASELTATLTIKRNYLIVGTKDDPAQIVVIGSNGISDNVKVSLSVPESLNRNAIRGFKTYKAYTLKISGAAAGEKFTLMIPVSSALISNSDCAALTAKDLYLYDGVGNMASAADKYTVKLSDDGAYYIIEGYSTGNSTTFVIAPEYNTPFWGSTIGIILIIVLVLLILLALFLIGMKLRRIERSKQADTVVIDTDGDVPTYAPVESEDKIEDVDACLEESIDDLAEELAQDVPAEETATDGDVDATAAVDEAMDEMMAEAAAEDLEEPVEDLSAADEATEELADEVAEGLEETVEAEEEAVDIAEEVEEAVADAMEENLNESADAAEAIALVAEEEDDDTEEDDDSEGAFGGFASGLTYIDVAAEPEVYAEMLEREARGAIQIVYRYRRSYQSRLAQSQGSVQDYYNIVKNLLLSYKGVKSRISWNYEAFNLGRTHVAKFNAKTRTLYIYMALDPAELADSKYSFADMSAKKKYASVPVLMKIKGDRKFKHTLEMITMLCEEKLGLQKKKVVEEIDYKLPYLTTDELVRDGLVKKLAASIPMELLTGEADANTTAVEEPAVETAPAEEIVIEEASVEEIPADAPAADDDVNA